MAELLEDNDGAGEHGALAIDLRSYILAYARPPHVAFGDERGLVLVVVQSLFEANPFEKALHMRTIIPSFRRYAPSVEYERLT